MIRKPDPLYDQLQAKRRGLVPLILACALLGTVGTFISTPRPTVPHILPLPHFDLDSLREVERREQERYREVQGGSLPNSIRAIGEQVRRVGISIYQRAGLEHDSLFALRSDVASLVAQGRSDELLRLRALQSQLFLDAVDASLQKGEATSDLKELGAEFSHLLFAVWKGPDGSCILDQATLRLMFRNHFNRLTQLSEHERFRHSLEELRHYYATVLEFPPVPREAGSSAAKIQLSYANALASADPGFDARPLQGILYLRLNQPGHAIKMFEEFLAAKPDAEFSHLVRSHLKLAYQRAQALWEQG